MVELFEIVEVDDEERELQGSPMHECFDFVGCAGAFEYLEPEVAPRAESNLFLCGAFGWVSIIALLRIGHMSRFGFVGVLCVTPGLSASPDSESGRIWGSSPLPPP